MKPTKLMLMPLGNGKYYDPIGDEIVTEEQVQKALETIKNHKGGGSSMSWTEAEAAKKILEDRE